MVLTSQPENSVTPPAPPPDAAQSSFVRDHFATLIVFTMFSLILVVYVLEIHWSSNDLVIAWLQNKMDQLIAAILMGLTGFAAGYSVAKAAK